jgi:hypothetical protein
MNKWFIQSEELVKGPFSAEDVQSRLSNGEFRATDLIWGPAQEDWRQIQWWTSNYANILAGVGQISPTQDWHFSINGQTQGPMTRLELIHNLKTIRPLNDVLLWTNGMVAWVPIYEFSEILTEMGVSRRQFPRAEIIGKSVLKTPTSQFEVELLNVSEGGFAVAMVSGVLPGQIFPAEMISPALKELIHAKVECRYVSNGITGFKFNQISVEQKSLIIQYVNNFMAKSGSKAA